MRRVFVLCCGVALCMVLAARFPAFSAPSAAPVQPGAIQWEWRLHRPGYPRSWLFNSVVAQFLVYGARAFGVNLVWISSAEHLYFPSRFEGQGGRVLYRSPTALRMGLNYLKHERRSVGINLGWSGEPTYDWEIHRDDGAPGDAFPDRVVRFALYNRTARDYVVYCERPVGINMRWLKDCPSRYPVSGGGGGSPGPSGPTRQK